MISQGFKDLLFLDNAPGHGHHSFSNIKLEILPQNTTSKLQALDAWIITQVKAIYKEWMLHNVSFGVQHNTPASDAAKKIDIYAAIEWLSLAWTGISDLNIQHCFNKVGFSQLCTNPNNDSLPDPDLDSDVTNEMRAVINIPFRDFIKLESDKIIHPVVAEPGILQADADIVPDNYQSDEQLPDSTPGYNTSIAEDIDNLAQIRENAATFENAQFFINQYIQSMVTFNFVLMSYFCLLCQLQI